MRVIILLRTLKNYIICSTRGWHIYLLVGCICYLLYSMPDHVLWNRNSCCAPSSSLTLLTFFCCCLFLFHLTKVLILLPFCMDAYASTVSSTLLVHVKRDIARSSSVLGMHIIRFCRPFIQTAYQTAPTTLRRPFLWLVWHACWSRFITLQTQQKNVMCKFLMVALGFSRIWKGRNVGTMCVETAKCSIIIQMCF